MDAQQGRKMQLQMMPDRPSKVIRKLAAAEDVLGYVQASVDAMDK